MVVIYPFLCNQYLLTPASLNETVTKGTVSHLSRVCIEQPIKIISGIKIHGIGRQTLSSDRCEVGNANSCDRIVNNSEAAATNLNRKVPHSA